MKKFLALALILASSSGFASETYSANRYQCVFATMKVNYSLGDKSGSQSLQIDFGSDSTPFNASGTSISVQKTSVGSLVTVSVYQGPDDGSHSYTFIVPQISLDREKPMVEFRSVLISTMIRSSKVRQELGGAVENNFPRQGKCKATNVQF